MAVYVFTGGLGAGKSLLAVSKIREAIQAGRRVATNMNIRLEKLVGGRRGRYDLRRIADYPRLQDLEALGFGSDVPFDESKFGWLVLDEASVFLNARHWNVDPNDDGPKDGAQKRAVAARMAFIYWLRHCRKFRWHLILITQGAGSLDTQVRNELMEHEVKCRRTDRMSVPVISWFTDILGLGSVPLPKLHIGVVFYLEMGRPLKVAAWKVVDARSLYPAYDTEQRLDGECLGASMLGPDKASYLWKPRGLRELVYDLGGWRWFGPSEARRRYDDARLSRLGGSPARPPVSLALGYAEFARAARAGSLGGAIIHGGVLAVDPRAGEATEPECALEENLELA